MCKGWMLDCEREDVKMNSATISFQIKSINIPKESKVSVVEEIGLLKRLCSLNENFFEVKHFLLESYLNQTSQNKKVLFINSAGAAPRVSARGV